MKKLALFHQTTYILKGFFTASRNILQQCFEINNIFFYILPSLFHIPKHGWEVSESDSLGLVTAFTMLYIMKNRAEHVTEYSIESTTEQLWNIVSSILWNKG